jgi:hypothetical protein
VSLHHYVWSSNYLSCCPASTNEDVLLVVFDCRHPLASHRRLLLESPLIEPQLRCCGYFSPYVEATVSPLCYPRSISPGCKNRYLKLERTVLETWYTISFSLVPAQILIIVAALLCSNHITYRFGKGLTPKRYRLDLGSMAVIMDEYAR